MAEPSALHEAVAVWYATNARDLPWRRTRDPYAILVSEVMLQQTQVDRAIPKYHEFLSAFPTLQALAAAPTGDVIRAWSGMGYNNRAVRLQRTAQAVVSHHGGRLPRAVPGLLSLPGIGPYTAAAVASFAFGANVPLLDTNIYRVLSRVEHGLTPPTRKALEPLAAAWLPAPGAPLDGATWHQALMDIGATVCTVSRPRCMLCPVRAHCAAAPRLQSGDARALAESSVPYKAKQGRFEGSTRFYRGRIVAALGALANGGSLTLAALGPRVRDDFDAALHAEWLRGLVRALAKDGVVRLDDGAEATVSLP
ncbi:MAG: A/G-specific adenine glycosylase [SAR202 cluster bacterium]|nr:A/G-specific adenine glycosylase [SAR202 cluster bacterium]